MIATSDIEQILREIHVYVSVQLGILDVVRPQPERIQTSLLKLLPTLDYLFDDLEQAIVRWEHENNLTRQS